MLVDQRVRQMFCSWTTFCSVVVVYIYKSKGIKYSFKRLHKKNYHLEIENIQYCLKIHKLKMSFGILCQGYQISSLSLKNFFMSTKKNIFDVPVHIHCRYNKIVTVSKATEVASSPFHD